MSSTATLHYAETEFRSVRYELVAAYDARVGLRGANRQAFHDPCCSCWYLRRGEVRVEHAGDAFTAGPGDWVLGDPRIRRSQRFRPDTVILSVRFQQRWSGPERFTLEGLPRRVSARDVPDLLAPAEALVASLPARDEPGQESWRRCAVPPAVHARWQAAFWAFLAAWHAVLAGLGDAIRPVAVQDERVQAALAVLAAQRGLGVLPYEDLRRATGLSRPQLDRQFRRELGCTPRRWLEDRCLASAERALQEGDRSIKQIAAALHFTDSSHFAKWFRRRTGRAPSEMPPG